MEFTDIREEEDVEEGEETPKGGFLMSVFKGFLLLVILALVVLSILPSILSSDASRKWALAKINEKIAPKTVSIESWSFGWFSAPEFKKIEISDPEKNLTVKVDSLKMEKGLLRLLPMGKLNMGRVTLTRPDIAIAPLEVKASLPAVQEDSAEKAKGKKMSVALPISDIAGELVVVDGKFTVQAPPDASFVADQIGSTVKIASFMKPIGIQSKMRVGVGSLSVQGSVLSPAAWASGKNAATAEELTVKLQQLDLSLFSSILRMLKTNIWIANGVGEGSLTFAIAGPTQFKVAGGLLVADFSVAGEKMKPSPKAELALMADLAVANRDVTINAFDFASPWLKTRSKGELQLGSKQQRMTGAVTVKCDSDLKAVVRDFGPLLGVKPDFTMQSGRLMMDAKLEAGETGLAIDAKVTTADLQMKISGEPLLLKPAPALTLQARLPQGEKFPEIGELRLTAPFADVTASGRLEAGHMKGNINLTAFSRDFRRIFKALPPMVGAIDFSLDTEQAESRVSLQSRLIVSDLAAEFKPGERTTISKGSVKVTGFLPIEKSFSTLEDFTFSLAVPGGSVAGKGKRFALNTVDAQGVNTLYPTLRGFSLSSEADIPVVLRLVRPFLSQNLRRQTATLQGQIVMNATAEIAKGETKVLMNAAGQRISLTQSNLLFKVPDIRVESSVSQGKPTAPFHVEGETVGTVAIMREQETLFAEKDAKVVMSMALAPDFNEADIKNLAITSELLVFKGKVKVTELLSRSVVDAQGESTLDCERVTQLLNAQGIDAWTLTGRSTRPFSFKAPVAGGLSTLFAEGHMACAVAIASGQGMGLKAGPADASMKLSEGQMKIAYAPVLNEGKMKLNPILTMERNNLTCTVPPKTRVLEKVQLSQEMLDGFFVKLFPLFKGSVAQQGSVTLDATSFQYMSGVPIEQGLSADVVLQLDDVKVHFGETLRELLSKMQSKSTLWEQKNVTLRARILNGRITLDPVTLVVDRHPITLSGWVDSKGAINYVIEVTLTERLIGVKGGKAIGKVIKVPVTGTINEPKIEMNALLQALAPAAAEIIREEVQDHAKDLLENLRKELKKKKDKEKGKG
jgi:hypothetical protein